MSYNTAEVATGGVVLAAAIAFGAHMLTASGGFGFSGDTYPLFASFRSTEGVQVGTDVRMAGVKVGSVSGIDLDVETFRAKAEISIREDVLIPDDSAIVIASEGLLGGNYVEISPGGSPFTYEEGDEILDTQGSVSLISLLLKYVGGGE